MNLPPRGVSPARLFRLLLSTPRPKTTIEAEFARIGKLRLDVVGLTSLEFERALDRYDTRERALDEVIAQSVYEGGAKAFASVEQVRSLSPRELERLGHQVLDALNIVSPIASRCDYVGWMRTLEKGAKHSTNSFLTFGVGSCVDYAIGAHRMQLTIRPDRYFGLPACELTDGQQMAFRAAVNVVQKQMEKKTNE